MSNKKFLQKKKPNLFGLLALLVFLAFFLHGCNSSDGSDDYDEPVDTTSNPATETANTNALIEPSTLKSWMNEGLVGSKSTFNDKVVIIDVNAGDELIQGASKVSLNDELIENRIEGVAKAGWLVASGKQMDACIQSLGIDENTTIVFTTPGNPYAATRAYWSFRYWGFPKDRLKVLNGGNEAFKKEYPSSMTDTAFVAEKSDYSVQKLDGIKGDLRASIGEVIQVFDGLPEDENNIVFDALGDGAESRYQGTKTTSGKFGYVVVVDGHPEGGQALSYKEVLNDDNSFKSAAEIKDLITAKGWDSEKKATVYCTSGYAASVLFFALDAIVDTDVQLHDASWSQTGKYSDYHSAGGEIPAGSNWAIDDLLDPATILYNNTVLADLTIETLGLDELEVLDDPFTGNDPSSDSDVNPAANDIEEEDQAAVGSSPTVTITEPDATDTLNVLIEPATLQDWTNAGLVNADLGQERVVILDATSDSGYSSGHIPGAQFWDISQHVQERLEGPAPAVNMAVNATRMNQLIQEHSIDEHTTIVFTTGAHPIFAHRAYFLFRYYGWSKNRLKVLNGHNGAWPDHEVTTEVPTVPDSSLTVQDVANLQPDFRLALPEFMDALRDNRGRAVDVRGDSSEAGSTSGVWDNSGDYVVFEGRPKNGTFFDWTDFMIDYAAGDERFKSADALRSALNAKGVEPSSDGSYDNPVYSYCRTGYLGSTGFFVFDAILGWDAMLYDGSWSQFGKMSDNPDQGGQLSPGSPWALDNSTYMEEINYNVDATLEIEPLNPDEDALEYDPLESPPNQVEKEDADYIEQGSDVSDDGGGAPQSVDEPVVGC